MQIIILILDVYLQDFTYEEDYYKWVDSPNGAKGAGLEHHTFAHLDCPLTPMKTSGYFVLAKFINDEKTSIAITAFQVSQLIYCCSNF